MGVFDGRDYTVVVRLLHLQLILPKVYVKTFCALIMTPVDINMPGQ